MNNIEILSQIALTFINSDDFDSQMNVALYSIGKHLDVSRVYVFMDNEGGTATSNRYEWCNKGIMPHIHELQNVIYAIIPSWQKILLEQGQIYSENIYELPQDILSILEPQKILSIVVYPIFIDQKIKGFVGLDECKHNRKWNDIELSTLRTISGIISSAYERKIVQDQIVSSRNNFQDFFESVDDLFIICNAEGGILHANQTVIKKLGYSLAELKGMDIIELYPYSKKTENSKRNLLLINGELQYCPLELEDRGGNRLPVESRMWFGQWDNQDCIFCVAKDLSKEQEALRKFTKIFENNPTPMVISREGKFTEVNSAFLTKLGYSKEEVIGKTTVELGLIVDLKKYHKSIKELGKTKQLKNLELNVKCKDGKILNGLFSGEMIENQGKKSFLTVMVDITEIKQTEEALRESEKRFNLALNGAEAGLWDWDIVTNQVYFSPLWKNMLGYETHEVENSMDAWKNLWHPDDAPKIEKAMQDYLQGKIANYEMPHRMRHKNGEWRWILTRGSVLKDSTGRPYRWVGTNIDITKEKEKSEELERFFSINLDLLCIADIKGNFIKINKSWTDTLGYSIEELTTRTFLEFIHPDDVKVTLEVMAKLENQEQVFSFVNRYRCKGGFYRYIEWRSHPHGNFIYAAARDITEHIETENRIREISTRDYLTNIYNRRYIYERLESIIAESIRENKVFSVSILDIDRFKRINDQYGHQAGDFILKEFTKIIGNCLRSYDLLGRFGGEEFIIVSMNAPKEQMLLAIERILEKIRNEIFTYNNIEIRFTFSAGIADSLEYDPNILSIEKIIETADNRLYEAKHTGRNKIIMLNGTR